MLKPPFINAMVIPTGVGASIGGFGGDATPQMNLLASVSDILITHPNVANAAAFQKLPDNALYVEGYGLDQFFQGRWALRPVRANRIGVVFDAGIEPSMRVLHLNTLHAVQAVYGIQSVGYTETAEAVEVSLHISSSGTSTGQLHNPAVILEACQRLIDQGAEAIALCVHMPDFAVDSACEEAYQAGTGVDPVGGLEAILSHLVVSTFQIPCAHAPVFSLAASMPEVEDIVDPRAASEFITPTFLPCVLTGLARAPRFIPMEDAEPSDIRIQQLNALVLPANALGGIPVLCAAEQHYSVIAVQENQTVLAMEHDALSECEERLKPKIYPVTTYYEAVGVLQAMRLGLSLSPLAICGKAVGIP